MADNDATRRDPTLAQNDDAPTPQDQFKPAESHFGQNNPSHLTDIQPQGAQGQQQFSGDLGASGHVAEPGQAALMGNDQAGGGGLGQNQQGYGQSPDLDPQAAGQADPTSHDAQQQSSAGIAARQGTLGPSPTGGSSQPASATTGGPDLSKGLSDSNRSGG
jgi:hypothetical protein